MGRMWPVSVMPFRVCINATLNRFQAHRQRRSTHPSLHILEDPLDLGVELPCLDLAADVHYIERFDTGAKFRSKLAAVIRHQKPRRCPTALDRALDQILQFLRCGSTPKHLHRDDLPTKSIDYRSNLDPLPEYADLGHIQVPHLVWLRRVTHMCRCLCHTNWCMYFRRARRPLLKHSPDRRPAHTNPSTHDVPRDRPRPEFGLRKSLSNLVNKPADTVMQSVPRRTTEQLLGF